MTKGKSIEWKKLQREKNGWESKYNQFYGKVEKHINRIDFPVRLLQFPTQWLQNETPWSPAKVLWSWFFCGFCRGGIYVGVSINEVIFFWKDKCFGRDLSQKVKVNIISGDDLEEKKRDNKKYNSDYSKSVYFLKFFF